MLLKNIEICLHNHRLQKKCLFFTATKEKLCYSNILLAQIVGTIDKLPTVI